MATSVRLPDMLKVEAASYAGDLGISLNALVAVALREYLDSRVPREAPPVSALVARSAPAGASVMVTPAGGGNREARRAAKRKR